MERSGIKYMNRLGKKNTEISKETGKHRNTISKVLKEPVDKEFQVPDRKSIVDVYQPLIKRWLKENIPVKRMMELVKEHEKMPYTGGKTAFYDRVAKIKKIEIQKNEKCLIGFDSLPGEFLQIDWGEAKIPFEKYGKEKRYFFCTRLKYSRYNFVVIKKNMKAEAVLRGILKCFEEIGGIPWCLVFDNMKTVTTGRDQEMKPIWNQSFKKFAAEMDFHPDVCWPNAPNQKGSIENLVGFVKSNFIAGRTFHDDEDLNNQCELWLKKVNNEECQATEQKPADLLRIEQDKFIPLFETADEYGIYYPATASIRESLITLETNRYSVPEEYSGQILSVRVTKNQVKIFDDSKLIAFHERSYGRKQRIRKPEHFENTLSKKPRAKVMVYREILCDLSPKMLEFVSILCMKNRNGMNSEILKLYDLFIKYGKAELLTAIELSMTHNAIGTCYVETLLRKPESGYICPELKIKNAPDQSQIDRDLKVYEKFVN